MHVGTVSITNPPKTAIEAINRTDLQISGASRHYGAIQVDAVLVKLLNELYGLIGTSITVDQMSAIAGQIRVNFWMLRIDEIVYCLNKGVNGGFGKIYGQLNYLIIAEWLTTYIDTERASAIEYQRIKEQGEAKQGLKDWNIDLSGMIEKFSTKQQEQEKEKSPVTAEEIDNRTYQQFMVFKSSYTEKQLSDMLQITEQSGLKTTTDAIRKELQSRQAE